MLNNVGLTDRMLRTVLSIILFAVFFSHTATGTLGYITLIAGIILLLTSVVGFCPLYALFGASTCPRPNKK
jgi:Protein of unknown function (DUF2892)